MFICRNAEGVHGQRKVGNPCYKIHNKKTQYGLCNLSMEALDSILAKRAVSLQSPVWLTFGLGKSFSWVWLCILPVTWKWNCSAWSCQMYYLFSWQLL